MRGRVSVVEEENRDATGGFRLSLNAFTLQIVTWEEEWSIRPQIARVSALPSHKSQIYPMRRMKRNRKAGYLDFFLDLLKLSGISTVQQKAFESASIAAISAIECVLTRFFSPLKRRKECKLFPNAWANDAGFFLPSRISIVLPLS